MNKFIAAIAVATLLAGCDDENPFDQEEEDVVVDAGDAPVIDDGEEVSSEGIPAALSGVNGAVNLESVAFDSDAGTLSVDLNALDRADNDIPLQEYVPNAALTALAPGFEVFSFQDDALDRMFVAIVAQTDDGSVLGAVVMDGGQFNRFFGGGFYATDGNFTPGVPSNDTGLVSYAGNYAGLTNLPAVGDQLLPVAPGTDPALLPRQPAQVTGSVFINADFSDNSVNGAIFDRSFANLNPGLEATIGGPGLEDVVLIPAAITDSGTFFGTTEDPEQNATGSYGGTFGGTEASAVSGVIHLDGDFIADIDNEEEFGVFVLTQCGQAGDAAICDDLNP